MHKRVFLLLFLFQITYSWYISSIKAKSVHLSRSINHNIQMIEKESLSFKRIIIPSIISFSMFSSAFSSLNMPVKAIDTSETFIVSSVSNTVYQGAFLLAVNEDVPGFSTSFENVLRVRYSLPQIAVEIEKSSDASPVVREIKLLLTNYKLKENINKSLDAIRNSNKKININVNDARSHGTSAVEYLSTIYEYFEEDIDNATGKKAPKPEVLGLAYKAIGAATEELDKFIASIPEDVKSTSVVQVKSEFNY